MDETRIETALRKGEDAFWAEVAKQFPEATTGDLAPEMVHQLRGVMERAIRAWVEENLTHDLPLAE